MKYDIDEAILKAASACSKMRMCVTEEGKPCCTPIQIMRGEGEEAALIECPEDSGCSYCHSFGNTHICLCPVRMEIYRRYGQ